MLTGIFFENIVPIAEVWQVASKILKRKIYAYEITEVFFRIRFYEWPNMENEPTEFKFKGCLFALFQVDVKCTLCICDISLV